MKQLNTLIACPVCSHSVKEDRLSVKDWMITKTSFTIVKCSSCGFHYTNPIPCEESIGAYYKSEEYVSHSSSKKGLINWLYNFVRSITLKRKVSLLKFHSSGKELLDIGAGTGHFLNACQQDSFSVQGLEPDLDARAYAFSNFQLSLEDISLLSSIESQSKDIVTMWHVLEHVYHLKRDVADIVRVLKKDGVLFIAVPNMNSYDAQYYKSHWAAYDVPRHLYHFQPETIRFLFDQFDMECIQTLPMKFDSYYVSMLSEKYKGGSSLSAIYRGFLSNFKGRKQGFSSQIYVFKKK